MGVGYAITKLDLDNTAAREVAAVWLALDAANKRNTWLNDAQNTDANMLTPLGYSGSEITLLRATFTDLNKLWGIAHATQTQASTNDFFFNAKKLSGVNWYG